MKSPTLLRFAGAALFLFVASEMDRATADEVIHLRDGFHNFRHRAMTDKKAHVAFLGGSITQNAKGHTAMIPAWLKEQFPEAEISVTNAGLSSTGSVSGAFRVADDVLAKGPVDLFVVEFAVNDDQDSMLDRETAIRGMEGIIRQVRGKSSTTDILMVHYINPDLLAKAQAGEQATSVAAHESVAEHWHITTVNLPVALAKATADGSMNWERYGGVHPNQEGYRWATGFMTEALAQGWKSEPETPGIVEHKVPDAPLDPGSYGRVISIPLSQTSLLEGWTLGKVGKELLPMGSIRSDYLDLPVLRGEEPGSIFYLEFSGRALTAFVLAGPDAGTLDISIDGGDWKPVTLFHRFSTGLNYPRTVILADDLKSQFHQAAIRISETKPEGSEGHAASLLKLGVSE
ncbi:MAG: SGNH/GDSL hydrolase family protein [Verrucomicrobiae bacterium]|nr:SGNH/GDSL hydrolase family protein [Verrucomicrobiae bacterium]